MSSYAEVLECNSSAMIGWDVELFRSAGVADTGSNWSGGGVRLRDVLVNLG